MSHDTDDPLRVLEPEAVPPPHLKGRITQSLRHRGLLRSTRPVWRPLGLAVGAIAAALLLFATGVRIGSQSVMPAADTRPAYVLMLYAGRDFHPGKSDYRARAEYGAWAVSVQARGVGIHGMALANTGQLLRNTPQGVRVESGFVGEVASAQGTIDGMFIIRATNEAEAAAIARTCPHLRYGGWIALRPIIPTS